MFIDVGGNNGDTVLSFLAGELPGVSREQAQSFDIYAFEPNPRFRAAFEQLSARVSRLTFIAAAAHDSDGVLTFAGDGLGGTAAVSQQQVQAQVTSVQAIDFSRWLARTVTKEDHVLCKVRFAVWWWCEHT